MTTKTVKKKKRGQGEGSIYKRKDGLWAAAIMVSYNKNGNPVRKVIYGKTRQEVAGKLTATLKDIQTGLPIVMERHTLGDFLNRWVEDVVKQKVKVSTYLNYKTIVDVHLKPELGKVQLTKLTPERIQTYLNEKLQGESQRKRKDEKSRKLSARTVKYIHSVLKMALKQAMKWKLVPHNAAMLVDPPKVKKFAVTPIDQDEAKKFLEAIKGDRYEAIFTVALALGLRRGEALGLRWDDVDFENQTLMVTQSLQRLEGKLVLQDLKTDKSRRMLDIPNVLLKKLQEHRIRQLEERLLWGSEWIDNGLVFTNHNGKPIDPRNLKRKLDSILKEAKIRHYRIHDLRHFFASLLLAQGVELKIVSELLGHSNTRITDEIYTHVLPTVKKKTIDLIDVILTGTE